jgi:ABC-type branched-subunit amino acid transport system ATPase component
MALPTGPLDEPQHRMWYSSQENGNLVFSRQHLSGVEVNRIASLDPRKTFVIVLRPLSNLTPSDNILYCSWLGQKRYLVRGFLMVPIRGD